MELGRLRSTEWAAGILAVCLLGIMFVDWYGQEPAAVNAWQAFSVTDVLMALLAAMGIAIFLATATQPTYAVATALTSVAAIVSIPTMIAVLFRVFFTPDDLSRSLGPSLGLAVALALTLAIWFGLRNERPGHGAHLRSERRRIAEIETLPAPPPAATTDAS